MNVLLSSIAKNDIKLLMRVFNAEEENKGFAFLEFVKKSVHEIVEICTKDDKVVQTNLVYKTQKFPVYIHYILESEDILLVTAIFKGKK